MSRDLRSLQRRLGERVRTLRQRAGLTQEQLATRCGLSQKYLSDLERGVKSPSFESLVALAHRGFDVRLAVFFFSFDEEAEAEVDTVERLIAGLPPKVRATVLGAVATLLKATRADLDK